ncbi:MAG: restriction endonuclease subunit S [Cyanobacteria bacterium J06634_6]
MIRNLKPYSAYKDSGVPWLGEVPKHWDVLPNRTLFFETKERNYPDEQMLSVTISKGIIKQSALLSNTSKKDSSNTDKTKYKLVHPGDIAYNKMRAWQGAFGVSDYRGIVSPAYVVIRARKKANTQYFYYVFRTPSFAKEAERWSYGITSDQWSLRPEHFKMIYCCCPPIEEQEAIAHFLNYADRRIRRYIRSKQKLIKLLEEQKQVVINEAVTRGLGPKVTLKPSGIEDVGHIPEHWVVRPLKSVSKVQTGITLGKKYLGKKLIEIPYLRVANVQAGYVDLSEVKKIAVLPHEVGGSLLQVGDVLMTEGGDPDKLGRGCVWEGQISPCIHQNHVFAVRPDFNQLRPRYLSALLGSQYSKNYFLLTAKQTTNLASTNKTKIGQFPVVLPNTDEQDTILEVLDEKVESIEEALSRVAKEIVLLREFRTRLIADVVTGKLDVREAVSKLPTDVTDFELSDADLAEDDIVTADDLDFDESLEDEAA